MNPLQCGRHRIRFSYRIGSRIMMSLAALLISCSAFASDVPRLHSESLEPISEIVDQAVKDGRIPGAVVLIGQGDRVLFRKAFGWRSLEPDRTPMTADVIFDVASLTKVIATATAVMQLVEQKKLALDKPAAAYWPAFGKYGKGRITLRHLLTHYSGLRVEPKLKPRISGCGAVLKAIASERPLHPPGRVYQYSDLNFIILGELARRASGLSLDRYCSRYIFAPIEMKDTSFKPEASLTSRIAPTVYKNGHLLCGVVHDPLCRQMGGTAGHAGLFSTADDLAAFARMMLAGGKTGDTAILRPESVEAMTIPQSPSREAKLRGLGWDLRPPFAANADLLYPAGAYSHLGYTGTGIWIDPITGTYLILLTNRVHPHGGGSVSDLREAVIGQIEAATGPLTNQIIMKNRPSLAAFLPLLEAPPARVVDTGIDILKSQNYSPLAGMRVGLITNHTGRDAAGIRTIDLLYRAPGFKLVAIFSPEHGISGTADAKVSSARDGKTGLPVYSLYGENRKPTKEMMEGLDALVFDIQDAGARFYTYISTMYYAMEAAAVKGIPFFVLDRPNPITAHIVQGPVSNDIPRSFTSCFPIPVRHGMTMGELARLFNAEDRISADLHVVRMSGYSRKLWYDETGLHWFSPSPNLRGLEAATLYPGVALVEGANVSVGRGTPTPFELVGAPWISSAELAEYLERRQIPGVRFSPADFIPESGTFKGKHCHGIRIELTDRNRLDPVRAGIEIIAALRHLYPDFFRLDATLAMIGSKHVLEAIRTGQDPENIVASWQGQLETFMHLRANYLLY